VLSSQEGEKQQRREKKKKKKEKKQNKQAKKKSSRGKEVLGLQAVDQSGGIPGKRARG
jgi:hypothetical protein